MDLGFHYCVWAYLSTDSDICVYKSAVRNRVYLFSSLPIGAQSFMLTFHKRIAQFLKLEWIGSSLLEIRITASQKLWDPRVSCVVSSLLLTVYLFDCSTTVQLARVIYCARSRHVIENKMRHMAYVCTWLVWEWPWTLSAGVLVVHVPWCDCQCCLSYQSTRPALVQPSDDFTRI